MDWLLYGLPEEAGRRTAQSLLAKKEHDGVSVVVRDTPSSVPFQTHMLKRRTKPRNLRRCTARIASPVPVVSNDTFGVNRHAFLSRRMSCPIQSVSWTTHETAFELASRSRDPVRLHACCFVILQLAKTFPVSTPPSFTLRIPDEAPHLHHARCCRNDDGLRTSCGGTSERVAGWRQNTVGYRHRQEKPICRRW